MSHPHGFDAQEFFLIKTGALDQIKDIIVAVDNQNRLTYLNKAAVRQYGQEKEKLLGSKLTQLYKQLWFSPEDEQKAILSLREKGYWEGVNVQLQPDGTKRVVETVVSSIKDESGREVGLLSISRDITSRVNVDDWLLESNQRLKYVVEAAGIMVYEIEDDTKDVVIVRGLEQLLGYSVGEVPSTVDWWISQIYPEDKSKAQEQFHPTKPVDKVVNEYRIKSKNGDYIFVQGVAKVLRDKAGKAIKIIGSMQDITEHKKAEEELKRSEERFYKAFNGNPSALAITRVSDGLLVDVNETYLRLFGFSRQEVIGRTSTELGVFADVAQRKHIVELLQERGTVRNFETTFRAKTGKLISVLVSLDKLMLDHTEYMISTVTDITERKQLENSLQAYSKNLETLVEERTKELQHKERLAAIGATAGMVGHDIRNPLQAITGDVYLLRDYLSGMPDKISVKHDVAESLEEIEKNVGYINKIVADLQDYSRAITPELKELNLYDLVTSAFRTIAIPENVNPSLDIDPMINLKTDPTLFTRILTNLVINAIQAMPTGGDLSIVATKKQETVVFSVGDTGVGIPEHVKPKLFTPMMTTKSKGQGLGLAVVKRLVEALKGTISFESEEGKGTKFIISLPTTP